MWKNIDGYKWPYRINEDGVVQKFYRNQWVVMTATLTNNRVIVKMRMPDGKRRNIPVVHLMADAFMGGHDSSEWIIHLNHSKFDNRICNLRKVKASDGNKILKNVHRKVVAKIDTDGNIVELYPTAKDAARKNYVAYDTVCRHCYNKVKHPYQRMDFTFQFCKE